MSRRRDTCHWILKGKSVDMVDSKKVMLYIVKGWSGITEPIHRIK